MTPEQVVTLSRYNARMNEKVYAAAERLSDDERRADLGAFFKSVHRTLDHILWADGIWMSRFEGLPRPPGQFNHESDFEFEELWEHRRRMDERIDAFAHRVTKEWLAAPLSWGSAITGPQTRPAWIVVTHVFNHATHHRGQVTTLLTQQGIDVGSTDLPWVVD